MKEQGFADTRFGGDLAHGAFLVGVLGEHPVARVEDGLLLLRRQGEEFFIHGWHLL